MSPDRRTVWVVQGVTAAENLTARGMEATSHVPHDIDGADVIVWADSDQFAAQTVGMLDGRARRWTVVRSLHSLAPVEHLERGRDLDELDVVTFGAST